MLDSKQSSNYYNGYADLQYITDWVSTSTFDHRFPWKWDFSWVRQNRNCDKYEYWSSPEKVDDGDFWMIDQRLNLSIENVLWNQIATTSRTRANKLNQNSSRISIYQWGSLILTIEIKEGLTPATGQKQPFLLVKMIHWFWPVAKLQNI